MMGLVATVADDTWALGPGELMLLIGGGAMTIACVAFIVVVAIRHRHGAPDDDDLSAGD